MYQGKSKILPAILLVIIVVVAIVAIVAVGRSILGRDSRPAPADDFVGRTLLGTDADHSVRMTVRGPITGDENFYSYQIEISPIGRRLTTYNGFQGKVIEDKRLPNNTEAYTEFVHALNHANFTREAELNDQQNDTRGVCATGRLYDFEVMRAQSPVKQLWASSCRGIKGSFRGDAPVVRSLFLDQIPDNRDLLREINL